jgi:hypothetical protein
LLNFVSSLLLILLSPNFKSRTITVPTIKSFFNLRGDNFTFVENDGDINNIFFVYDVVELLVLLRLYPHAALALVDSYMTVSIEEDCKPLL